MVIRGVVVAALVSLLAAREAAAQPVASSPPAPMPAAELDLPEIDVVATAPLPGAGIDRAKVPANIQSLSAADLARDSVSSVTNALADRAGSININDTLGSDFQPDVLYRGFAASPVLGSPQGLAVYQNGVRINETFGDTVNWDLVPDIAIDRLDIVGSNPVYGLNALGGAVVVTMKNGFTYQGFEAEALGGSFGERGGDFQFGKEAGGFRDLFGRPPRRCRWVATLFRNARAAALCRYRSAR